MPGNDATVNVSLKPLASQSVNLYANSAVKTADNQYTLSNGVGKVVIDKAASTTNFRTTDTDHTRIYKNMNATISANGAQITKVVFTCTSNSYASAMVSGTWPEGANATASGSIVTVTIPQLTEVLFKASYDQVRVSKVEITYVIPEGTKTITMTGDTTNVSAAKSPDKANYSFGDSVTITLTPTSGTIINSVNVTGTNATISEDKRTITFMVSVSDISVEVLTSLPHNIAVTNDDEQSTVVLKVGEDTVSQAYSGEIVSIQVTPIGNYAVDTITVKKVSDDSAVAVTNGTFTMPDEAVSVEVVMRAMSSTPHAINLSAVEHATVTFNVDGTPTSPAQASEGSTTEIESNS